MEKKSSILEHIHCTRLHEQTTKKLNNVISLLTVGLFLVFSLVVKGQNIPTYTTPPTTASLGSYVENPVSLYTGTPQISIPLYPIKLTNGLNIPIALSYHAGGVKIEEQASDVGLNWSLLAGGMITRVVKGIPDDTRLNASNPNKYTFSQSVGRFYLNDSSTPGPQPVNMVEAFNPASTDASYLKNSLNAMGLNLTWGLSVYYDLEPDEFYFNFAGISGKFVINVEPGNFTAKPIPFQDLKISWTTDSNGRINTFTVVDDKGNTYYFSEVEQVYQDFINNSSATFGYAGGGGSFGNQSPYTETTTIYNASWYLTRIIASNGEEVDFTYANDEINTFEGLPDSETLLSQSSTRNVQFLDAAIGKSFTTTAKRLTAISTPNEQISFPALLKRSDVDSQNEFIGLNGSQSAMAITGINVYQKTTNQLIKSYKFNYSYFQSPALSNGYFGINNIKHSNTEAGYNSYFQRLRLDNIQEVNSQGITNPPYNFTYDLSQTLPYRFSYQQDLWGYFNGASTNQVLIPSIYIYPDLIGDDRFRIYPKSNYTGTASSYLNAVFWGGGGTIPSANRLPDPTYTSAGSLIQITYPTGGYTKYTYEPHAFFYDGETYSGGGLRIKQIDDYDNNGSSTPLLTHQYTYTDNTGQSSGRVVTLPRLAEICQVNSNIYNNVARISVSSAPLGTTSGSNIGYKQVTETLVNASSVPLGQTIYKFDVSGTQGELNDLYRYGLYTATPTYRSPRDQVSSVANYTLYPYSYPFSQNTDYDWNRGQLISEAVYNSSGALVKRTTNNYGFFYNNKNTGPTYVYGLTFGEILATTQEQQSNSSHIYDYWVFGKHAYLTDIAKVLMSSNVVYYNNSDSISAVKSYAYNGKYHDNITSNQLINSQKDTVSNYFNYPEDFEARQFADQSVIIDMVNRHMTNTIVQTSAYKNSTFLHSQFNHFWEPYSNLIVLNSKEDYYPNNQPSEITSKYTKYDALGNLLEFSNYNGPSNAFLWGYNSYYPVVKVINAPLNDIFYDSFEGGNGNSSAGDAKTGHYSYSGGYTKALSGLDNGSYTLSYWLKNTSGTWIWQFNTVTVSGGSFTISLSGQIDDVRFYPQAAQMTSYTYDPLIGLTSTTDAKGQITYYEYDNFQRLKNIKDKDGNILKNYCYNYAGQSVGCAVPTLPIYARVEITNQVTTTTDPTTGSTATTGDVYIRLYSDAACTHLYAPPSATSVIIAESTYVSYGLGGNSSSSSNVTFSVAAGTSVLYISNETLYASNSYFVDPNGQVTDYYNYGFDAAANGAVYTPESTIYY
jgi:YD repeat-containing protein